MEVGSVLWKVQHRRAALRTVKRMHEDGVRFKEIPRDEVATLIAAEMMEDDPSYAAEGFDWQALIDLIIKLLPLILALFG
jgi:hypothetical protein